MKQIGAVKLDNTLSHSGAAFQANGRDYYLHLDEGFDQGITVLDISDLRRPHVVSTFRSRPGISVHNVEVAGHYAFVSYYIDGLRVLDLSNPEQLREVAHYDTVTAEDERELFSGAWGVKLYQGRVYISDMQSGVLAFEVDLTS
jgi:hypothetical protein